MSSILIIGGGVIGLTLARELHQKGIRKITILERGEIGKEASFAAAGMLAPQAEADRADEFFDFCNESKNLFPLLSEKLLDETGVDIELDQSGTLYAAFTETDVEEIRERFDWQKAHGLEVEHLSANETHQLEPFISPDSLESLIFPNDWQVDNRKLIQALRKFAEINDINIVENAGVTEFKGENRRVKTVRTSGGPTFRADQIIVTAGAWSSLIRLENAVLPFPTVKPIRGQMIAFHTAKRLFSRVIYSPRGYIVPRKDGKILAGATVEDVGYENETTESGIESLLESSREISPSIANLSIDEKWSGLRPFSFDGLPIVGALSDIDNVFAATGHYRNGILLAPMTAKILADKIVDGIDSDYLKLCNPDRVTKAQTP